MNLRDILQSKGDQVFTIPPTSSLAEAVQAMVDHGCGSLIVGTDGHMAGIISERDILRALADVQKPLESVLIADRMTTRVITGHPDDDLGKVMGIMTQNRIRHLPVMNDAKLVGMVSIGDIVKAQYEQLTRENYFLMNYIQS
jgi:CBS domain-containing protein